MSSSQNIYNAVGRFFGWQNIPQNDTGVFFGFAGMTRPVMIAAIEALQRNSAYLDFKTDNRENRDFWFNAAYLDIVSMNATGGAPVEAFTKWFNWLYVAAAGNDDIRAYFGGRPYSVADYVGAIIGEKLTDAKETIEYGLEQESAIPDLLIPTKSNFWKWVLIGGGLLFVGKKLKLI